MARIYPYLDLVRDLPPHDADVLGMAHRIGQLPAIRSGYAVPIGSAAWGDATWRSDIDLLVFECEATIRLVSDVENIRTGYETASQRLAPRVDLILVGAEHEELVERDNLVSKSSPILEPLVTRKIFDRIKVRLGDHVRGLAQNKGEPWSRFADTYLRKSPQDEELLVDIVRDYLTTISANWRAFDWSTPLLDSNKIEQLEHVDGFSMHFARMILAHQNAYPVPDRRSDVRRALPAEALWGIQFAAVLEPLLAIADVYETLSGRIRGGEPLTQDDFDQELATATRMVDFSAIEELTWDYLSDTRSRDGA